MAIRISHIAIFVPISPDHQRVPSKAKTEGQLKLEEREVSQGRELVDPSLRAQEF